MNDFFAMLYEAFGVLSNSFPQDLYTSGTYVSVGLIMVFSSLILESIYYFLLSNYGNFHKRTYWFTWLITIAIINFIVGYVNSVSVTKELGYTFSQYFTFSMVNVLWAVIFSFVFSLIFKIKSISASRTPF